MKEYNKIIVFFERTRKRDASGNRRKHGKALLNGQKYDESCKEVFKNREVIAPILKYVAAEAAGYLSNAYYNYRKQRKAGYYAPKTGSKARQDL